MFTFAYGAFGRELVVGGEVRGQFSSVAQLCCHVCVKLLNPFWILVRMATATRELCENTDEFFSAARYNLKLNRV